MVVLINISVVKNAYFITECITDNSTARNFVMLVEKSVAYATYAGAALLPAKAG